MRKISKLLPSPQMEEDFISCVSYAPLCFPASVAFLGRTTYSLILFSNTFCRLSDGFIPSFFRILPRWVVILDSALLSRTQISLNFLFCRMR